MIFKPYGPGEIERKWQKRWEEEQIHKTGEDTSKPKFYCLDMFPYPSGDGLHVGHWRGYVLSDVWSRIKKLQGFNVLHPMGWDAFGLPAENDAIKKSIHPQVSTGRNITNFKRQLVEMGAMYDWDKEVNTGDPGFYKFTQWIFIQMYKRGLAYRKEMPINWCPSCKTGLANEEVVDGRCERCETEITKKPLEQWMLRITSYADRLLDDLSKLDWPEQVKKMQANWIGRSEGAEITFPLAGISGGIKVFTTRIETLPGATFVVLAPEHLMASALTRPEYKGDVEEYAAAAMRRSAVERMAQGRAKTGVFTGSYAENPFNGEAIPIWISDYVLTDYGTGAIMAVPALDDRDAEFAHAFHLAVKQTALLDSAEIGRLFESGCAKPCTGYKLRDWIFSRQRYWGEPIPIIHCSACGEVPVPEEDLPVTLPYVEKYEPSGRGESPLALMEEWVNTACPKCGRPAKRETNTMPQWAGSSWYFLRYCDPHNPERLFEKAKADYWLPVDFYIGGNEHAILHLLYARFYTKFLCDIGVIDFDEPFTRLFNIGMICKDGYKMSKSKPNCVNSDATAGKYGTDALRLYEMFIGPPEQSAEWNDAGIEGVYRFLAKTWAMAQNSLANNPPSKSDVLRETHRLIKGVAERLENQKVNTVISLFMGYINLINKDHPEGLDKDNLGLFITLLSPFAPHFAEEVWEAMGNSRSIFETGWWPAYDPVIAEISSVTLPIQVNGRVKGLITVDRDASDDEVIRMARSSDALREFLQEGSIQKTVYVPGKIVNFVVG